MPNIEELYTAEDVEFMKKINRSMKRHQLGPELFFKIGHVVSHGFLVVGQNLTRCYSTDLPPGDAGEPLS